VRLGDVAFHACAVQVSIDTACSSALVGAHTAAQHLHKHGGAALSAGINLMLAEHTTAATQVAGRCQNSPVALFLTQQPNPLSTCS
jgi:acyl transferase domain-containing protein